MAWELEANLKGPQGDIGDTGPAGANGVSNTEQFYRVDETVGRRVFIWDAVNARDQIIYADTGWRDIVVASGTFRIRRYNSTVFMKLVNFRPQSTGTNTILPIPEGFRAAGTSEVFYVDENSAARASQSRAYNPYDFVILNVGNVNSYISGGTSYLTGDAWPTTLPGTASGTIPNL